MRTLLTAALTAVLLLAVAGPAEAQTGHDLFQQALVKERADGDLRGAIAIYVRIAREFTANRTLAAKALVQLGQCYEKLGSTEAERAYRRVVREFADQDDLVVRAQSRLAALQRAARAAEPVSITTRQVWSGLNAGAHDPTPDGRYLIWNDFQGTMNLAAREITTGQSRFLTYDARYQPTWAIAYDGRVSPDGNWVAHGYSEEDEGGSLRVVGMDGENLRELLREKGCWIHVHGWTSDSEQILGRWDCWSESNPKGTHEVILVSVVDETVRAIHELPNRRYGWPLSLSPDNQYLLYGGPIEKKEGNHDIWIKSLDGGAEVALIEHPADDRLLGWVPGTDHVLFLSDRDGTWDLWAALLRDGAIAEPPYKIQRDMGEVTAVGFSEDGSFFYSVFTRWFNTSIAPFDVITGSADLESAVPLLGSNRNPVWSPDGEYLVFVTESEFTEGKLGRLNIRHLATGEQRELAIHLGVRWVEDWSPDGRSILVFARDETENDPGYSGAHYAVDVVNEEATTLLDYPMVGEWPQGSWVKWSRDGEAIIYSFRGEASSGGRLVRRELESGEERELYRDSLLVAKPLEESPDGRYLVFPVQDSIGTIDGGGLAVLDIESGTAWQVVHWDSGGNAEISVQWTPGGDYLLITQPLGGADDRRTEVLRVAVSGAEPEHLWTVGEGKYGSWIELNPDGTQIALTTYTQENEIWVMENLREVLEPRQ
jgi:Tol biopolymer transport system component